MRKTKFLEILKDELIGEVGTLRRDLYETKLEKELKPKKAVSKELKKYNVVLVQKAITYLETTLEFEATSKKEAIKLAKAQREKFDEKPSDGPEIYELTGEETYNVI